MYISYWDQVFSTGYMGIVWQLTSISVLNNSEKLLLAFSRNFSLINGFGIFVFRHAATLAIVGVCNKYESENYFVVYVGYLFW